MSVVHCAVVKDHDTGEKREFTPDNIEELCSYLDTFDVLIGHNCIDFDFPVLRKLFGWEYKGRKICTLIMSRAQRPARTKPKGCTGGPHSVEAWGLRLGLGKVVHEDWGEFSEHMLHRCSQDVDIQVKIYYALLEEGEGEGWEQAHALNMKLFHYLQRQEEYGWYIDKPHMDRCLHFLNRWIDRIDRAVAPHLPMLSIPKETKKEGKYGWVKKPFKKDGTLTAQASKCFTQDDVVGPFSRVSFRPVDLDKAVEVKAFLLAQGWEPDEWNKNNAGEQTSPKLSKDDSFRGIQGSLGKLIAKRVQCKQRRGVIEGLRELLRSDNRIGARVAGMASTGRIRHSGIVNIPSPDSGAFFSTWMRSIFSSEEGKVLVGCDSKGNQIRQLAARMGEEEFTNAVLYGTREDGTDLHSVNQKRSGVSTRTAAKNFFYGFLFGAGDTKIGKIIGSDARGGRRLREEYLNNLPGLRRLIDTETERWRSTAQKWFNPKWNKLEYRNGYIKGLDGRPILVESEHTILVYRLQSDEAIQMAAAYTIFNIWMEWRGYQYGLDYGCVIWYHDEYQVECREEIKAEVAALMEESIAWAGRHYKIACPHEGEAKIGKNWSETH